MERFKQSLTAKLANKPAAEVARSSSPDKPKSAFMQNFITQVREKVIVDEKDENLQTDFHDEELELYTVVR